MLVISRAALDWRTDEVRAVFRAAPGPGELPAIAVSPGIVVWTPPRRCLVRSVVAGIDTGDPLVAAGGATTASVGAQLGAGAANTATTLFIQATSTALWNTAGGRPMGWGNQGPQGASLGNTAFQDGGVLMWPADQYFPSEVHNARTINVISDVGTYTGTLLFIIQWRPV